MVVWIQRVESGGLEGILPDLERMPGFLYLHLLEAQHDPQGLVLIYWQDEISMLTWRNLTRCDDAASTYRLQRSFGPDVI